MNNNLKLLKFYESEVTSMTISEICKKAREEGWRFEYSCGAFFAKAPHTLKYFEVMSLNRDIEEFNIIRHQLGHAIAEAMNGGKDE